MLTRIVAALLVAGLLASPATAAPGTKPKRPNIIILLADDLGYADAGFQGCKDIPTPHIDSLARNGVRFTSGYVSGPYCSPTRAGLMTGRYQNRFGHEFNPGAGVKQGMPVSEVTMADRLRALGYVTGLVGKWHLGGAPKMHPTARGFQEFFGFLGGAHSYFPAIKGKAIQRGTSPVEEKEYLTDAFAREAVGFIDKHAKEPFFLYLAFNAVHTPMEASAKYLERFPKIADKQRRTYAAMLSAMDDAIGRVLAKLREHGLEDDTLIFFFSDNGGPTMIGTTINGSRNFPLRGSKRQLLEGGVRVPFVLQWKGRLPGGKQYDHPIIALDILPTALAAAGAEVPAGAKLDGVNLLPYLEGKVQGAPHDTLYWRFGEQLAVRRGDWKLVRYDNTGLHLYNLKADIGEANNLAAKHPEKVKELKTAWDRWNTELAAPLWGAGKKGAAAPAPATERGLRLTEEQAEHPAPRNVQPGAAQMTEDI
ncbi:MAG TPA: sulfatase, partial [Gemmataceae bacterium]|nr:sulfatase [Gemmataceae bacterium]